MSIFKKKLAMKKSLLVSFGLMLLWSCQNQAQNNKTNTIIMETPTAISAETIYQFKRIIKKME